MSCLMTFLDCCLFWVNGFRSVENWGRNDQRRIHHKEVRLVMEESPQSFILNVLVENKIKKKICFVHIL